MCSLKRHSDKNKTLNQPIRCALRKKYSFIEPKFDNSVHKIVDFLVCLLHDTELQGKAKVEYQKNFLLKASYFSN